MFAIAECFENICKTRKEPEEFKRIILPRKEVVVELKKREEDREIKIDSAELVRSYQPNIVTLYVGYLNAKMYLYKSFVRLNDSKRKRELLKKVYNLSWRDYNDILIKFCGFHKLETCEKKITTSSLYGVDLFKEYLNLGYDLYIVPPLVYDTYLDDIAEMDFHSYYVDNHFEKVLNAYNGKGRVLVRGKNK